MPHFPDFTKIDLPPSHEMRVQSGALPATPENAEQIAIPALARRPCRPAGICRQ